MQHVVQRMADSLVTQYGFNTASVITQIAPDRLRNIVRGRGGSFQRDELRRVRDAIEHQGFHPLASNAIVGSSVPILQYRDQLDRLAAFPFTSVILVGESGTGKSLGARYLHTFRTATGGHFVEINPAAMPDTIIESELFGHEPGAFTGALERKRGLMEVAGDGILFIDEVDSMPLSVQAKFLTVLERRLVRRVGGTEEYRVNCDFVAAASEKLWDNIRGRRFRSDLYYRLAIHIVRAPALRDHLEDVEEIVGAIMTEYRLARGVEIPELTTGAITALQAHHWPGNVRELRATVERLLTLKGKITYDAVLDAIDADGALSSGKENTPRVVANRFVYPMGRTIDALVQAYTEEEIATGDTMAEVAHRLGRSKKWIWENRKKWRTGQDA